MSPGLRLVVLASTAAVLFGLLAAGASAIAYPVLRARVARLPAAQRSRTLLLWAAAPVLAGALLVALCFLPSAWSVMGLAVDHCPVHDDGHVHLCFAHAPGAPVSTGEWLLVGIAVLGVGTALARVVAAQTGTHRAVATLRRLMVAGGRVPSAVPLSVTAGLFRPVVLVSTGLEARLSPEHLAVVLAHERAHAERRDPLRVAAASVLCALHLPGARRLLLADLTLACEQAADDEAARAVGDRLQVAEALLSVERVLGQSPTGFAAAMGMDGGSAAARVENLLAEPDPVVRSPSRVVLWMAATLAAVLLASTLHHVTETLLEVVAR